MHDKRQASQPAEERSSVRNSVRKRWYTVREAAAVLKVSRAAIYKWIERGQLKASKAGPGQKSPWRIAAGEIARLSIDEEANTTRSAVSNEIDEDRPGESPHFSDGR